MTPSDIEKRLQVTSLHTPGTTFIGIENTHTRAGGSVTPLTSLTAYRGIADTHKIHLHLDGARMFNACADLDCEPRAIAGPFDSVNFCLSKALGAPVGSVLCGKADFITQARRWRKRLGGGTRQAGILAAAGLVGLRSVRLRLGDDHARAARFAATLKGAGLQAHQQTNFVMIDTARPAAEVCNEVGELGIKCMAFGPHRIRCVFHYDIDDEQANFAAHAFILGKADASAF